MTKSELVTRIAEKAGITKKAAAGSLDALVAAIHDALKKKEGRIRVADLGTFKVVKKKARTGVNPQTRQKIKIAATKVPRFSPSRALKEAVKKAK
ncbi:MAG: HU family DNA-binding protein [Deltaproteobacteria bacterium]|nr:HU family DNA-binding protein [Deltaproteobacteria bacterium]